MRLAPNKAAASEEGRGALRYVEPLGDVRTPLAAFFSILLGLLAVQALARAQTQFMWDPPLNSG
jgi:hypothetical protein